MFLADDEDTIEDMMDNLESPPESPLSESAPFVRAQQSLPTDRFMFAFAQNEGRVVGSVETAMERLFGLYGEDEWYDFADDNIPEYAAAAASFIDHGLRFDVVLDNPFRGLAVPLRNEMETLEVLPEDTVLAVTSTGLAELWDEASDHIPDADAGVQRELELLFEDVERVFDLELDGDVMESVATGVAVAFLPSDLRQVRGELAGTLDSLLVIGPGAPDEFAEALGDAVEYAEDEFGLESERESIGQYRATLLEPGMRSADDDHQFGYLTTDQWVVVGSTEESLETFHAVAYGGRPNLKQSDGFSELDFLIPADFHALLYADMQGLLRLVEGALDEYGQEDYQEDWKPWVESLDKVLIVGSVNADELRVTSAVTVVE